MLGASADELRDFALDGLTRRLNIIGVPLQTPNSEPPTQPDQNSLAVFRRSRSYIDEDATEQPPAMKAPPLPVDGADAVDRRDGRDLLTAEDIALRLRVTPAWVYAQTRQGQIPHLRLGRYVRYRREAIDDWIEQVESSSSLPPARHRPGSRNALR